MADPVHLLNEEIIHLLEFEDFVTVLIRKSYQRAEPSRVPVVVWFVAMM